MPRFIQRIKMLLLKKEDKKKRLNSVKCKVISSASVGFLLLVVAVIAVVLDPLTIAIRYGTAIKKGSFLDTAFRTEVTGTRLSLYVFNITNEERFMKGLDRNLKLQEVGPFTYVETRRNGDIEMNEEEQEVWFTPHMTVRFLPEESVGDPARMQVTVPNLAFMCVDSINNYPDGSVPLLTIQSLSELDLPANTTLDGDNTLACGNTSAVTTLHRSHPIYLADTQKKLTNSALSILRKYNSVIRSGFSTLAWSMNYKIIAHLDAESFLWGYKDPLIGTANLFAPGLIYFDRLGIIDRLYDNNTIYRIRMSIKHEDKFSVKQLKRYLKAKPIDQQVPLESYNFTNTYEGASFPPGLSRSTPLNVYRIGVCRHLNLEFHEELPLDYGPIGWAYKISNETFNRDCGFGVCGMLDLSNCTYGIPIALSRSHFLNTDPRVYERIEGMRPDPEKHDSTFVLEPKMGLELKTQLSLQLNMALGDISFNSEGKRFSNMTVPIAYIQVVQPEVFDNFKAILKAVYVYVPIILLCTEIVLVIVGTALVVRAAKLYCDIKCSTQVIVITEKQMPLITKLVLNNEEFGKVSEQSK